MKGKISIAGSLFIERNGIMKLVFCPFMTEGGCNDACALFEEPLYGADITGKVMLNLCHKTLYFCSLKDERVGNKNV
jgi:hypothetical protein